MQKFRWHAGLLIFLALLAFMLYEYRERSVRRDGETGIVPGKIIEISISDSVSGVILSKDDGRWILDSGHEAREKTVDLLLQTLGRLRTGHPAPGSRMDELSRKMDDNSVRVSIRQGRRTMTYYFYSGDISGVCWMKRKGDRHIYSAGITGFGGPVNAVLVTDEGFWRTDMLFDYLPADIEEIEVVHGNGEGSFNLQQPASGGFRLTTLQEGDVEVLQPGDSLSARYLAGFMYVPFERFANHKERGLLDSLRAAVPDHVIRIRLRNGTGSEVSFHRIISGAATASGQAEYDIFRLHALINGGSDMVIVPWHSVDLLLRTSSYFTGR